MERLKDKKIEILAGMDVSAPGEFERIEWAPIHQGKLWAYVKQMSAREFYAAAAVQNEETMMFEINWRSDIKPNMYVKYKSRYYNIIRIDTYEDYKKNIRLYADGGSDELPAL